MGGAASSPREDVDQILDDHSLWLSSHPPARSAVLLKKLGITHVLAVTHVEAIHFPDDVSPPTGVSLLFSDV